MSTPYMVLEVPTPGITPGPTYAQQISADLPIIDAHDHSLGKGAPVPIIAGGGLRLDATQKLGILLDGTSLALGAFGLKVNDLSGLITVGSPAAPNANGLSLVGTTLAVTPANSTNPGVMTTLAQTLAGLKTFQDGIATTTVVASGAISGASLAVTGAATAGSLAATTLVTTPALSSLVADGPGAIGFTLDTSNLFTGVGSKLLSVQNSSGERLAVTFDGHVHVYGNIDALTATVLAIGGATATEVDLGRAAQVVKVLGNLQSDSGLDRATAGALVVGGTTATEVDLGRVGQLTKVLGNLQVDGNTLSSNLDRAAAGTLAIGGTTATQVDLGRVGQLSRILGDLSVLGATSFSGALQAAAFDALPAGALALGTVNATSVSIGVLGSNVTVIGNLLAPQLDTAGAGALNIGTTTAAEVNIGVATRQVKVLGNLQADGVASMTAVEMDFGSNVIDGASAIGFLFNTTNPLATAGAKLVSVNNQGVEHFAVTHDGYVLCTLGLDTLAAGTLALGGSVATEVDLGRSAQAVKVLGNLQSDSGLDSATATTLAIGGATATSVTLGRNGQNVSVLGNLKSDALDRAAGGILAVGGTTATEVDVGRSGQTVKILGSLAPAATAAISVFGTNVGSGAAVQTANQYIGADGYVELAGHLVSTSGTVTAGTTLATLDAAYRPNRTIILPVVDSAGAAGSVTITSSGVVTCTINLVNATNTLPLDAIRFRASN